MKRLPNARVTTVTFVVHATQTESAKWIYWSRLDRSRTVGRWLARLAALEVRNREETRGVYDPPPAPRLS